VKNSEELREGAHELVDRALATARALVDAGAGAAKTCRVGRKANPGRRTGAS